MNAIAERAKSVAGGFLILVVVANILLAAADAIYTSFVPTPAQRQLATTHADMVGTWTGGMRLEIKPDATVSYTQSGTHYGGKIWRFDGRSFSIWVFPAIPARFEVAGPPTRQDGEDALVVDGYHLRRQH